MTGDGPDCRHVGRGRGQLGTRPGSAWLGQAGGWPRPMATTMLRRVGLRPRLHRLETRPGCRMAGEPPVLPFADSRWWRVEVLVQIRLLEALVALVGTVKLELALLALESPDSRNEILCHHANVRSIVEK